MRDSRLVWFLVVLSAILVAPGCSTFVMTATSQETLDAVREAMTRTGATEEAQIARVDLDPEELEVTFARRTAEGDAAVAADKPAGFRTIFVRIVPWGDDALRRRSIIIDAWRWHGVPPMWSGSAKQARQAADQAMNEVLAERRG